MLKKIIILFVLISFHSHSTNVFMSDFKLKKINEMYEEISFIIYESNNMKFINKTDWIVGVGGEDTSLPFIPIDNAKKDGGFIIKPLGKDVSDSYKNRFLQAILKQNKNIYISDLQPEALPDGENTLYFYTPNNLCSEDSKYSNSIVGFTDVPPKSINFDYDKKELTTFAYLACVNNVEDFDYFFNLIFSLEFV